MPIPLAHISIITRLPVPGESKTRMIDALGAQGAADLQREMTEVVVRQMRLLAAAEPVRVEARVTGGSVATARRWLGIRCAPQGEGDLGLRLAHALAHGGRRASVAVVVGGDCPSVTAGDMRETVSAAAGSGAAIIPAADGGFCALALRSDVAACVDKLLSGIEWGSKRVCEQTMARISAAGHTIRSMPTRADVDLPEDLPSWHQLRRHWIEPLSSLTVVIPTLNEAERLPVLLDGLASAEVDVVIADGGSSDDTRQIASRAGVRLVTGVSGRAAQMNLGATASEADALLFLHADTTLPRGFPSIVREVLRDPGVTLGTFSFSTDSPRAIMRLLETGTRLRSSLLSMPYGDQGLFCRRGVFEALGGFPTYPVMEDYEFVRRARRAGRIAVSPERAVTSERRWREFGALRWTMLNLTTVARYHLGASPEELAAWRRERVSR